MAKKVFAVYLAKEGAPNSEAFAKLDLPASPWELWDAMEKVRLKDDKALYINPRADAVGSGNCPTDSARAQDVGNLHDAG